MLEITAKEVKVIPLKGQIDKSVTSLEEVNMTVELADLVVHCRASMLCKCLRYKRPVTHKHCGKLMLVTHNTKC